jgi:hypothetical protein
MSHGVPQSVRGDAINSCSLTCGGESFFDVADGLPVDVEYVA